MLRTQHIRLIIVVMLLISWFLPASVVPQVSQAAGKEPGLQHCTDWPEASYSESTNTTDIPIRNYQQSVNRLGPSPLPLPVIPVGPDWNVLLRDDSPFAIFYTETYTPSQILDPIQPTDVVSSTIYGNYDEDNDAVPDFAERIQHCFSTAYRRYIPYYDESIFSNIHYFNYLLITYNNPTTAGLSLCVIVSIQYLIQVQKVFVVYSSYNQI